MLNLDRATAIIIVNKVIAYNIVAIVEAIKESSFMYSLSVFSHLGLNIVKIMNCGVNIVAYTGNNQT